MTHHVQIWTRIDEFKWADFQAGSGTVIEVKRLAHDTCTKHTFVIFDFNQHSVPAFGCFLV